MSAYPIDKSTAVQELAKEIQACKECYKISKDPCVGVVNSIAAKSKTGIGLWTDAFPNFNAKFMIVGQDWGSEEYLADFLKLNGGTIPEPYQEIKNATWANLMEYLKASGIDCTQLYLTNAVLCLRKGKNMSGYKNFQSAYLKACFTFLEKQIDIVQPKVIAALGQRVFNVLTDYYRIKKRFKSYHELIDNYKSEEYSTETGIILYPLFHTGYYGVLNRGNRNIDSGHTKMIQDFKKLRNLLDNIHEKNRYAGNV